MRNIRNVIKRAPLTAFVPLMDCKPNLLIRAEDGIEEVHTGEIPIGANSIITYDTVNGIWNNGDIGVFLSSDLLHSKKSFLVEPSWTNLIPSTSPSRTHTFNENIDGWRTKNSGGTVVTGKLSQETNAIHIKRGAGSLKHEDAAANNTIENTDGITLPAGTYTIGFDAKKTLESGETKEDIADFIQIKRTSNGSLIAGSGTKEVTSSFKKFSLTFDIASTETVVIKIKTGIADKILWIDSVILTKNPFAVTFLPTDKGKANFSYYVEECFNETTWSLTTWFKLLDADTETDPPASRHTIWEVRNKLDTTEFLRIGYNNASSKVFVEFQNKLGETFLTEGTHPALQLSKYYGISFQYIRETGKFLWVLSNDFTQQIMMSNVVNTGLSVPPDFTKSYLSIGHQYGQDDQQSLLINTVQGLGTEESEKDIRSLLLSTDYPYSVQESIIYALAKEYNKIIETGKKVEQFVIFNDAHLRLLLKERSLYPQILPWADSLLETINYFGYADIPTEDRPDGNRFRAYKYRETLRQRGTLDGLINELRLLSNDETATIAYEDTRFFINELYPPADDVYFGEDYLIKATFTNNTSAGGRLITDKQIIDYLNDNVTPFYFKIVKA